jgi:membrane protease YdiL (CAAX protease family)
VRSIDDNVRQTFDARQAAALAAALAFPTLATFVYFIVLSGNPLSGALYGASKVVQFAFPLVWVVTYEKQAIRPAWPRRAGVGLGLALGAMVMAGALALYYGYFKTSPVLAAAPAEISQKMKGFHADTPARFLALAAFLTLLHSLLEEYYWRWFVFGRLNRLLPFAWAAAVSSLGFMAHHVLVIGEFLKGYGIYTWFFSCSVAVGGALWAWIYHRTRTLYGPWVSHLLVDAALMWIGYDLLWGTS